MTRKKIVVKDPSSKKDDLDPTKDEFVTGSMSFLDWLVEHRRQVGALIAVALLISVAAILYAEHRQEKAAEASSKLSEALSALTAPVIAPVDESGVPASRSDDMLSFDNFQARSTETLARVDKVRSDMDSSHANLLSFVEAAALAETGDPLAESKFREFLSSRPDAAKWLDANALNGLAAVLVSNGKTDEAAATAEKLKKSGSRQVARWAELEIARGELQAGRRDAARTRLSELMKQLSAEEKTDAQDYLFVEARAMLLSVDPAADVPELPMGISPEIMRQLLQMRGAGGALQ